MSNVLVLLVSVIYLATAIGYVYNSQIGLGITFLFYSLANVGLFLTAIGY